MKYCLFRCRRAGVVVHEAAMAIVLVGAILTSVAQILVFSAQQSHTRQQRMTATREVGNLMERLMARPWERLTSDDAKTVELSTISQATLPEAQLVIDVTTVDDAKRVSIELAWKESSGGHTEPVRLVAWQYPHQEAKP